MASELSFHNKSRKRRKQILLWNSTKEQVVAPARGNIDSCGVVIYPTPGPAPSKGQGEGEFWGFLRHFVTQKSPDIIGTTKLGNMAIMQLSYRQAKMNQKDEGTCVTISRRIAGNLIHYIAIIRRKFGKEW